ncbi:MAG TPA: hypothetical protein VFF67_03000 [Thermoplasmata archaeon]|nr:hypothetical protein [Thermoplasmata archaeon]
MSRARKVAGEVVTAVVAGLALLVLATVSAAGLVPGLGSGMPVLTIVLVVAGLLLLGAGLYVRGALLASARAVPLAQPRPSSPSPPVTSEGPGGPFIAPDSVENAAAVSVSSRAALAPWRGRAAAATAVQRSVAVAAAREAYPGSSASVIPLAGGGVGDSTSARMSPAGRPAAPRSAASRFAAPLEPEELEPPIPGAAVTGTSVVTARSSVAAWLSQVPQPPAPVRGVRTEIRACISCSTSLGSNLNVPLCWGCGRALCSSCYWKNGPGPGLHRCPDCAMQAIAKGTAARPAERTPAVTAGSSMGGPMASRGYSRS